MWNYRVIKKEHECGESEYGLYEVMYNDKGEIAAHTEKPELIGDSLEDLKKSLELMNTDLDKHITGDSIILNHDTIKFHSFCDNKKEDYVEFDISDLNKGGL